MNTFDNIIYTQLSESVVNLSKDKLDPTVFTFKEDGSTPILREAIKVQILKDVDELRKILPVERFVIIGSILTKNYDQHSDIDVSVQVDNQAVDSVSTADMLHTLKYVNGKMAADTVHPINYYIISHDLDETKAEAVYDVVNDKWLKTPKEYDPDVEKWATKFQDTLRSIDITTGELRRDLIDLDEIENLDIKNIKRLRYLMKEKLSQIEELLNQLTSMYHNTKTMRQMAFDRFLTPQELREFGSRNQMPENILYKLLEKYYYIKFIKRIETILSDRDELELTDVPMIKKIMGDLWKTSQHI